MTISKVAQLATNNASGSTFTVPAGVAAQHAAILVLGSASIGDVWTIPGWTSLISNPAGVNNMSFQVFTRNGGLVAGNTFTIGYNTGAPATQLTAVWYDTGARAIDIVGTPWTRNGVSSVAVTASSITTPVATDVILISQERTTASGTTVTVSPTATQDVYQESNTSTFPTNNTDTSHYIGHFAQSAAGATGDYTATYSGGSGNGVGVQLSIAPPPKAAAYVETFPGTTVDTSRYILSAAGSVSIVNGRLAIRADGMAPDALTAANLDLTGSTLCLEVIPADGSLDPTDYTIVSMYRVGSGASNYFQFSMSVLNSTFNIDTSAGSVAALTYNATNHRWVRFRHVSGTTVAFDASPTGLNGTWTELGRKDVGFALNNMKLDMVASTGMATGGWAYFDNINNPPPGQLYTAQFTIWDGTNELTFDGYLPDGNYNFYLPSNDPTTFIILRTSPLYVGASDAIVNTSLYPYPEYAPYPSTSVYPAATNEYPADITYPGDTSYPTSMYPNSYQYPGTYYPGGN
jgi:hypothetical protein